jgi:peptide deformylase
MTNRAVRTASCGLGVVALLEGCAAPAPPVSPHHHPEIGQVGEPTLRRRAAEVAPDDIRTTEFQALVDRLIRVMREAPGVGLAAPQLGVPLRVFVMEDREELMKKQTPLELAERERVAYPVRVWVNPEVRPIGERRATFFEGCLSVAGFAGVVERAHEVEIHGLDRHGAPQSWRVSGWPARTAQHEQDHLDGTVYVDRMATRTFMRLDAARARFAGRPIADVLGELGIALPAP